MKRKPMSPKHQKYLSYNADKLSYWTMPMGPTTEKIAEHFLKSSKAAEHDYEAGTSLAKL